MLVWSGQNRSICDEIFPENNHKSCETWLFFSDLSEVLHSMAQSIRAIRFENTMDRSRYKFGGKLALFIRFGTFFMEKTKQDNVERLF